VLSKESFSYVSLGNTSFSTSKVDVSIVGPRCLDQIVIAQRDEPSQKHNIYKLSNSRFFSPGSTEQQAPEKYYQIRVKSITFE